MKTRRELLDIAEEHKAEGDVHQAAAHSLLRFGANLGNGDKAVIYAAKEIVRRRWSIDRFDTAEVTPMTGAKERPGILPVGSVAVRAEDYLGIVAELRQAQASLEREKAYRLEVLARSAPEV